MTPDPTLTLTMEEVPAEGKGRGKREGDNIIVSSSSSQDDVVPIGKDEADEFPASFQAKSPYKLDSESTSGPPTQMVAQIIH